MPERKIIKDKIAEILAEISLEDDSGNYAPGVSLKDDLCLDSLSIINLVMELNQAFNMEIKGIEIVPENFGTVGNLEEFIFKKVNR